MVGEITLTRKEKAKCSVNTIRSEFKKSTNTAIIAAFSLIIALSWKDLVTEYIDKIFNLSPLQGKLISAIILTFVCVLGIVITTKILGNNNGNEN